MIARIHRAQFCAALLLGALAFTSPLQADESTTPPAAVIPAEAPNLFGAAVATDVDTMFVGAPATDGGTGAVEVFRRQGNDFESWTKYQVLHPTYDKPVQGFGHALEFRHSSVLAVAARNGPVFVFERVQNSDDFAQVAVLEMPAGAQLAPGSLSISDYVFERRLVIRTLAVGVTVDGALPNAGSVLMYERTSAGWEYISKVQASDPEPDALFGSDLEMIGDYMIVGAPGAAASSGAVYAFVRNGGSWVETQKLTSPNARANARFGHSVASNIGQIVVGEPGGGEPPAATGRTYFFRWWPFVDANVLNYEFVQELVPDDALPANGGYGHRVAIDGNNRDIIVTQFSPASSPDAQSPGSAYVFTLGFDGWAQRMKLAPTAGKHPGAFGSSLAAASIHAIVGDYGTFETPGAVYVYDLTLPPTAPFFVEAPENMKVHAPPGRSANVTFQVTVADFEGGDIDVHWEIDGRRVHTDVVDGGSGLTRGTVTFDTTLRQGSHKVRVIAAGSGGGLQSAHNFTVKVGDFEGPVIHGITVQPPTVPSQNGRYVRVQVKVDATDSGGPVFWRIAKVESSDPSVRHHRILPDWILGYLGHSVIVRADTTNPKRDRIYTLHIEAFDPSGNKTHGKATVTILAKGNKKPGQR